MSSETSTEQPLSSSESGALRSRAVADDVGVAPPDDSAPRASEPLQPWQLFTLAGLVGATIVVFLSRGQSPAGVVLLSLIVFAAAFVGVAVLRTFLPLSGARTIDAPQVLGGRTRAALERDKALVLRALKELEFDRAMGKVSDKDFAEMSGRLRGRAARIIRQLDAGAGYRQQIEQEIARRVGSLKAPETTGRPRPADGGTAAAPAFAPAPPVASPRSVVCASCRTTNDGDARFCKGCGQKLEAGQ
jgi:hypothetical protein